MQLADIEAEFPANEVTFEMSNLSPRETGLDFGTGTYTSPFSPASTVLQSRTNFLGTVRGRAGLAFGNLLIFGTGGFAYGAFART